MKICIVYSSLRNGGAEHTITQLSNYFVQEFGDIVNLVLIDAGECHYPLSENVNIYDLRASQKSRSFAETLSCAFTIIKKIHKAFCEIAPDVVLSFSAKWLICCKLAAVGLRIPVVGSERSNPNTVMQTRRGRLLIAIAARLCDGYIFPTSGAKACYPSVIQKKATVIPNGIALPNRNQFCTRLSHGAKICAAGRLIPGKRFDVLLKAFALVLREIPNASLTIYGEGTERDNLEFMAKELGVGNRVHFAGFVMPLTSEYQKADLFVCCSESESWGNVLAEALSCGLPCISSKYDFGAADMIQDGENGILVPVGDVEATARAMIGLLQDTAACIELSQKAYQSMRQYEYSRIVRSYRDYLMKVQGNDN